MESIRMYNFKFPPLIQFIIILLKKYLTQRVRFISMCSIQAYPHHFVYSACPQKQLKTSQTSSLNSGNTAKLKSCAAGSGSSIT